MQSKAGLPAMKVIGPGLWVSMHFMALRADTPQRRAVLIEFLYDLAREGPCSTCNRDFTAILETFDRALRTAKDAEQLFKVTVDMHNVVNEKIHKRVLTLAEAHELFDTGCTQTTCTTSVPDSPLHQVNTSRNAKLSDYRNIDVRRVRRVPVQRRVTQSHGVRPNHSYEEAMARHWKIHVN